MTWVSEEPQPARYRRLLTTPLRGSVALFFLVLLFAGSVPAQEPAPNNCHNPASWADWDARVAQHPTDTALQTLHALWLGLCLKVDRGEVTVGEAITLFEQARNTLVRQRVEEQQDKKGPAAL